MKEARELAPDSARRMELSFRIAMTQLFIGEPEQALVTARTAWQELPEGMVDERMMFEAFEAVLAWFGVSDPGRLAGVVPYRTDPPRGGAGAKYLTVVTALDWTYKNGPARECTELVLDAIADGVLYAADGNMSPGISGAILTFTEYPNIASFWEDRMTDAHRRGSMFGKLTVHLWRALTLLHQGELVDSERELAAGLEGQRLWGLGIASGGALTAGILARTLTEQGRLNEAREALESVPPEPVANYGSLTWRRARTELLLAERAFDAALDSIPELITPLADNPAINPWRTLRALALDGLEGDDRHEQAVALAAEEVELARASDAPGPLGRSLRVLGVLRRDAGVEHLREAAAVLEASQARLERAKALFALGAALRHARQPTEAREPLRRALDLATACGATGLVEDARSELAATGARPRSAAMGGVESLTVSERRVSGLAAEGLTNKDIAQELYVTPKTVEVHLSNAYRKLGIKSRHGLAAVLADGASPAAP
jgi:DNA-binding NarL/FixJ family response regulator